MPREPYLGTDFEQKRSAVDKEYLKVLEEDDDYWAKWDTEKENGVGCRCRCDTDIVDVEGKEGSCIPEWVDIAGGFITPA